MTKTFVQLYVENLLKVLKVLKTRTALKRNGLAEFRYAAHGKALKRRSKQRSKTELLIYQLNFKKGLTFSQKYDRI